MKAWEVPWQGKTLEVDTARMGALLDALGRENFGAELFQSVNQRVAIGMFNVTTLEPGNIFRNHWVEAGPLVDSPLAHARSLAYAKKFRHSDPVLRILLQLWSRPVTGEPVLFLHQMPASTIRNKEWREHSYTRAQLVDRFVMGAGHPNMGWAFLTLVRHRSQGLFTPVDVQWLTDMAPLLLRLLMRHEGLHFDSVDQRQTTLPAAMRRLKQVRADLTERELEVCSRILQGKTLDEIAHELGVSVNSVRTYRTRAFQRMGISSRFELLSIFLG